MTGNEFFIEDDLPQPSAEQLRRVYTCEGCDECIWVECPEYACPFDHSHTRASCGRPTCRES